MNNPEAVIDGLSIPVVNMRRRSATFSSLPWWLNRPGFGGGSQSRKDESHGGTEEVQRRAA